MIIKQISVFMENRTGTLTEVLAALSDQNINIRAMSVADTADFGIMRLIVNEPEKVESTLRAARFAVKTTKVLTMMVTDEPGGLLEKVKQLSDAGISVEYVYAFAATNTHEARVVLKVDNLELAEQLVCGGTPGCAGTAETF